MAFGTPWLQRAGILKRSFPCFLVPLMLACAADAPRRAQVECGEPQLVPAAGAPFDWVEVTGLPEDLGSPVAEVALTDGSASVLAPVVKRDDGSVALRIPVHPSFRIGGGVAAVTVRSETVTCRPTSFTIDALEPAPGAMAEATDGLRRAFDEVGGAAGTDGLAAALTELADGGDEIPLMAVPALWALPEMDRLERLVQGDSVAVVSPEDAEMLDAVARRLDLPGRMRAFHEMVGVANELIGTIAVVARSPATAMTRARPAATSPFRFAAYARQPARQADGCRDDRSNLFEIAEPAELDNLMRAQDYAERFLAGSKDQQGGSAAGTVFGDIGVFAGWLEHVGKPGSVAASVWDAFSTVVLNTAEAYTNLLPGDLELTVTVDPAEFEEDSERTGTWTASSVATSRGMKLTKDVLEKVMEKALETGLADASIGEELTNDEGLSKQIDKELLEKPTKAALDALLDAVGAKEVEGGFDIPGGCWTQSDMSASDDPSGGAAAPPPLVTGHLSGGAVEFTESGGAASREYKAAKAGTSRLEVRTAEGYRKAIDVMTPIATTYAFGGDQYVGSANITVNEIEVNLNPMIIRVEPGDRVPFVATVENAVDTRVRWTSSANPLDEIVDFGGGTHEAVLITPKDRKLYPITIEVESMSRKGARASGQPVRKATAKVQLASPVIDIRPPGGCLLPDSERQFTAQVLGVERQKVRWSRRGVGRITGEGLFETQNRQGSATIRATWAEDPEVFAEVDVRVSDDCHFFAFDVTGEVHGSQSGQPGIYGVFCADACRSAMQRAGHCTVQFSFLAGTRLPSLMLTALIPGELEARDYPIGNDTSIRSWADENRTPGSFYASLGTEKSNREETGAPRFSSLGGTLSITHIDDERIEGNFYINMKEEGPFEPSLDYRQRSATVSGMFAAPLEQRLGTQNFYDCSAADDR